MFCGWIACNALFGLCSFLAIPDKLGWLVACLAWGPITLAVSAYAVMLAWVAVFLPVDLLLGERAWLRQPRIAPIFGFIVGNTVTLVWGWLHPGGFVSDWFYDAHLIEKLRTGTLPILKVPFIFGGGITAMVAAYVRSKDSKTQTLKP